MVRTERPSFNEHRDFNERRHTNERQAVLPFNAAYRAMNQRDQERETPNPMQLELLPPVQPDLFMESPMSDDYASGASQGP